MSGLFAVNKPSGISSAGLLNDLQNILKKSPLFAPEIEAQQARSNAGRKSRKPKMGNKIKMGHGGTLDPLASGVLVVGTGRGTKDLGKFLHCSKDYEAIALFGCSTDTYDSEGKVVHERPWNQITKEKLESVLEQFRGDIMQTPPIYSALKMQGKPLYEYAREGKPLPAEIKARPATVSHFEITKITTDHKWTFPLEKAPSEIVLSAEALEQLRPTPIKAAQEEDSLTSVDHKLKDGGENKVESEQHDEVTTGLPLKKDEETSSVGPPTKKMRTASPAVEDNRKVGAIPNGLAVHITMTVSSGTYVRSLIHDLGLAVGSAAHMVALVRKRVGDFKLEEALAWKTFEDNAWQSELKSRLDFASETNGDSGKSEPLISDTSGNYSQPCDPGDQKAFEFLSPCMPFRRTLTYAQSLDAKISGPDSKPLTISCPESFRVTHELRRLHQLILIGVGTAISDDPGLNARDASGIPYFIDEQPRPVILDPNGRLNLSKSSKLMKNAQKGVGRKPIQIVHSSRQGLFESAADVLYLDEASIPVDGKYRLSWPAVFEALKTYGDSIMIEGGAAIIQDVLQEGMADQIIVTVAPTYVGVGTSLSVERPVAMVGVRSGIFGRDTVLAGKRRT